MRIILTSSYISSLIIIDIDNSPWESHPLALAAHNRRSRVGIMMSQFGRGELRQRISCAELLVYI